jgi:2-keto-4-pentenoate hydratase/2-oxohepta-3-ene-1,7-dioic acid hydratase in catechol pathway
MRSCRFRLGGEIQYGVVEERGSELWITDLAEAPEEDLLFRIQPGRSRALGLGFEPLPLSAVELLPPSVPSKIVCVGRNYRDHVKELGHEMPSEPLIFLKASSTLLASGGTVRMPGISQRVDFEGELALVIGRRVHHLPEKDWRSALRGCTLANDVTARDLQSKDGQWTRAKGFDTFCPVGPLLSDELDLESGVLIETRVNGELRQHASTTDFIFPIPRLLAFITAAMTLEPGDLVLTGTPSGVGPVQAGDCVQVSIDGLGVLSNVFLPE